MDFTTAEELLELCNKNNQSISQVMHLREVVYGDLDTDEVDLKMKKSLDIMRQSAHKPLKEVVRSMGGMIGGETSKLEERRGENKDVFDHTVYMYVYEDN